MKLGTLTHNNYGRYEIKGQTYFTSGECLEIFVDGQWIKGRMEYSQDKEDYYFISEAGVPAYDLNGVKARCKE